MVFWGFLVAGTIFLYHERKKDQDFTDPFVELAKAKEETSDPCGESFIKLVEPNPYSKHSPEVVVAGERIWELGLVHLDPRFINGEIVIRVVTFSDTPNGYKELMWYARGTKACRTGLGDEIKRYAITCEEGDCDHPDWPTLTQPPE